MGWGQLQGSVLEGEEEVVWEVQGVEGARRGLRGLEYKVAWKDWEGWDSWEHEEHLQKTLDAEMAKARKEGWECSSWREWLECQYSPMEVDRRVLWKGSRAQAEVLQMVQDFWEYAVQKGGGEEKVEGRRRLDAVEKKPMQRRSEGLRRLYVGGGLQESWSFGHNPELQERWGG